MKPEPDYREPFESESFGDILKMKTRKPYMTFEPQPHRLQYVMEDITRHHNIAYNNNPTALRHHKIIIPSFATAAYLLLAKKFMITSHDESLKLGFDFLSAFSLPHFPFVNKIVDSFGTIKTVHGEIRPRNVDNCIKICMILAFGQQLPLPIDIGNR